MKGTPMKKLVLAVAAFVAFVLPVSADATPKHHGHPAPISRAIDWD